MKMTFAISLSVLIAVACNAMGDTQPAPADSAKPTRKSVADKIYNERFGGRIRKPGTGIGAIGYVNVGTAMPKDEISKVMATIGQQLKQEQRLLAIDKLTGLPTRKLVSQQGVNVAVFIVDDATLPPMLAAPEDRWSMMNVARLREGLKDDILGKRLFAIRCRGELQRAFCYACGCGSSQYDGNIMNVSEIRQLDSINPDLTVADAMALCRKYLASINVTQPLIVTYSRACKEGWAPAPTNEYQKAIWDKVNATPKAPMKIEFDPKKGR